MNKTDTHQKYPFYAFSTVKFLVLSILTLGFFQYRFFYKNLSIMKKNDPRKGPKFPSIEATLCFFFAYRCFNTIKISANSLGIENNVPVKTLAFLFFIIFIFVGSYESVMIAPLFSFVFTIPINNLALKVNKKLAI